VLLAKYKYNDDVEKYEMGRACSTNGEEEGILDIAGKGRRKETPRKTKTYVDDKVDVREMKWGGIGWIDLAQDRDRWRALVNMIINFGFP
jgi:hypothetical protein